MKRILLILILSIIFAPTAQGAILTNNFGRPVGGQLQQWANQSKIPTYSGSIVLQSSAFCGSGQTGCSGGPNDGSTTPPPTYMLWAADRYSLYFELGHIFDW